MQKQTSQLNFQICNMKYKELQEKPKQFESLCGHSVDSFDSLSKTFFVENENYFSYFTFDGKGRERPKLKRIDNAFETSSDALFFLLSYVKNQSFAGISCCAIWFITASGKYLDTLVGKIITRYAW